MKPCLSGVFVAAAILLTGCSAKQVYQTEALAMPLQATLQQEVMLARMELILDSHSLTEDERAQLLYERGVLYDSMGLRALARNDFFQALSFRPDMPEVFNFLGIYFTQAANFDAAYEAFDSVLELDPTFTYAHFNRGAAFYYGGRYQLAQDDLLAFYHDDPNDPVRCLWLYLNASELNKDKAKASLQQCYNVAKRDHWGWSIVEFYLGKISEKSLYSTLRKDATDNTSLAEHLSETNFYLGKFYLSLGEKDNAKALFILTVANNVHNFVEHRYALLELAKLGQTQDDISESDQQ